jgi:hypothetical protein
MASIQVHLPRVYATAEPFKTKRQAEKARLKDPERQRKTIGVGVIRLPKDD